MDASRLIKAVTAVGLSLATASCGTGLGRINTGTNSTATVTKTMRIPQKAAEELAQSLASTLIVGDKAALNKTTQPIGAYEFCREKIDNCPSIKDLRKQYQAARSQIDLATLSAVNADVNKKYIPMTDQDIYGVEERWAYPKDMADCDDYMLAKRLRLIGLGVDPDKIYAAVVQQNNGNGGHAILLVETGDNVFVLDNLNEDVRAFDQTLEDYQYVKWSSDLNKWFKFEPQQVASAAPILQN